MVLNRRSKGFLKRVAVGDQPAAERHPLSESEAITLGRAANCEIVLDAGRYSGVSRNHAQVLPLPGGTGWQIYDLNSANGTFINGTRLEGSHILQPGDRILLGSNGPEFCFECERAFAPPPEPLNIADSQADTVSITQLLPITSTVSDLLERDFLIPGVSTVLFVVALFSSIGNALLFNSILALYLAGAGYFFVYRLCGKSKPWWVLIGAALATALLLASPLMAGFFVVFRQWLPGDTDAMLLRAAQGETVGFVERLVTFFFGAGLLEELVKALPVLAAYLIGRRLSQPWRSRLGVLEPLDGILLGAACGVGFTLFETFSHYLPATVEQFTVQAGALGIGEAAGLQLLIPRIIGNVSGHMAYSGYLGYFIGLGALKRTPARRWWIFLIGYLSAASIHALWNAAGVLGEPVLAIAGVLAFAFLMAAILKARKLSPTRPGETASASGAGK
ncbi:PrsW family glutamic-type intramembrane protease [Gloeobacter morelensis]|uniref:PrsW family intramembrane metalloprotease n=1 Tax=Gloeobacter morelensis MG652769 TaxID=2781736 RepID=A0ABY3PNX6_9CYAN|nr:PrsW family glutamic-type intramembrane protease [Gloeobacter morelensis]UFP95346.1 PrsW family intramembrane metalloprotease [Gloeobacter morelensis MG652769]